MIIERLRRPLIRTNRSDSIQTIFCRPYFYPTEATKYVTSVIINTTHGYFSYAFSLTVFQASLALLLGMALYTIPYFFIRRHVIERIPNIQACCIFLVTITKKEPISRFLFSALTDFFTNSIFLSHMLTHSILIVFLSLIC